MREIKFRGKRIDNNKWVYGLLIKYEYGYCITNENSLHHIDGAEYSFNEVHVIPETIGQFTGLKDKNGKEVFEGDIIQVLDRDWPSQLNSYPEMNHQQYLDFISSYCEVVFKPAEFYLKQIKGRGYFYPSLTGVTHRDIFKIIGNIYENPELIKE